MKPRFQFGLRNAVWATFWVSVGGASFSVLRRMGNELYDSLGLPDALFEALIITSCVLFIASPFIAAFSLFGRTGDGVVLGMFAVFFVMWSLLFIQ